MLQEAAHVISTELVWPVVIRNIAGFRSPTGA
uniref:Uncharacterized protein n=1 Tax=Peronospora matthiolae TaxID=2874970 RepID=A0AAV1U2Y1_9STRA